MADQVLGVDIGGVLWDHNWRFKFWTAIPHSFEVLKKLNRGRFKDRVFIVSHVLPLGQMTTSLWLWWHDFYAKTGISHRHVIFCRERKAKAEICRILGITHFIDDRTEIMEYLYGAGIANLYLFQSQPSEIKNRQYILPHVIQVNSWLEVERELLC